MKNFIRGNQIYSHWFVMFGQSMAQTLRIGFILGVIVFALLSSRNMDNQVMVKSFEYYKAVAIVNIQKQIPVKQKNIATIEVAGNKIPATTIIASPQHLRAKDSLTKQLLANLLVSCLTSWSCFIFLSFLWKFLGKRQMGERTLFQAIKNLPVSAANKLVKKRFGSEYKLGEALIPKGSEKKHMLIVGATGTGKTTCIIDLLNQIRAKGEKVIIIDTSGVLISRFYREGTDKILNPSDTRSEKWNMWSDATNKKEYQNIANFAIPSSHHDRYWNDAAKLLLTCLLEKLSDKKDNQILAKTISSKTPRELAGLLKGYPAEADMRTSDNQANSIKSVLNSSVSWIHELDNIGDFSISEWLKQEDDSWLFLSCAYDERASNIGLINLQFNIALKRLGRLGESTSRRIWFIGDELASLGDPQNVLQSVAELRKYGGCLVLAAQTLAQLFDMFGEYGAKIIMANTAIKVIFQVQDQQTAEILAKSLGEIETEKKKENISFGIETFRDGVSIHDQKEKRLLIRPDELMNLPTRTAFVKFSEGQIVTKTEFKIQNLAKVAQEFEPKTYPLIESTDNNNSDEDGVERGGDATPSFTDTLAEKDGEVFSELNNNSDDKSDAKSLPKEEIEAFPMFD